MIRSAASLYGAAADAMVITLTAFTLAMTVFPNVQKKAQDEIDSAIGMKRLPTLDVCGLPYIDAVAKEASRWWPVAPMGFPHVSMEEFEYRGHRIPKDACCLMVPSRSRSVRWPAIIRSKPIHDTQERA